MSPSRLIAAAALVIAAQGAGAPANAQTLPTAGALVVVPAFSEVTRANDQATAVLMIEEQDRDKAAAASRVNAKMREGTAIVRGADPQARLKTYGYFTYPVYSEDQPPPTPKATQGARRPVAWRVGQYLEMKTTNIGALEKTVAAAQRVLALSSLQFGLAPATEKALDAERIAATYRNLNERAGAIAAAMGRKLSDATLDTVDFEGSGNYAQPVEMASRAFSMKAGQAAPVEEPSFEPGETTLQMRLVGKFRFR